MLYNATLTYSSSFSNDLHLNYLTVHLRLISDDPGGRFPKSTRPAASETCRESNVFVQAPKGAQRPSVAAYLPSVGGGRVF